MNNTTIINRIRFYKTRASIRPPKESLREVVETSRRDSRFELMMKRRNINAVLSPMDSPVRISPIIEKPPKINKINKLQSNHKFKPPVNVKPINMVNREKTNIKKKIDFCEKRLDKDKSLKEKKANTSRLNSIKAKKTVNKHLTHKENSNSLKSNNSGLIGNVEHSNERVVDLELGVKTLLLEEPKTPKTRLSEASSSSKRIISPFVTVSRGKAAAAKEYHDKKNKVDEACSYFSQLLCSETTRLTELCDKWKTYEVEEKPPEDACDMIRMAIGQTELLLKKKFNKFDELIKICESGEGEKKINNRDLLGFWDIVFMEVIDLVKRFSNLTKLKNNNWEELLPTPIIKKTKKRAVVKKTEIKSSLRDLIREARKKNVQTDEKNFSPDANLITKRKLSNISNLKVEKTPTTRCNTAITPKSILKPQDYTSSTSRSKSVLFADHNKENSPHLITFTPVSAPRRSLRILFNSGEKPYQCDKCKYKCVHKSSLKRHILYKHTNEKSYQCNNCNYKCDEIISLKRHTLSKHGEKPYQCDMCEYKCVRKSSMKRHKLYQHTNEKPYQCDNCEYKCVQKSNLKRHILSQHTDEKPYQCDKCDYKCVDKLSLKRHILSQHASEKPYQCDKCEYKCVHKSNFKRHILSQHTDEKPYQCDHCDYKCVYKMGLKRHILSQHTDEKPYQCDKCDYKCVDKISLKRHILSQHASEKPYQCDKCEYKCVHKSNFKRHTLSQHTD